MTGRRCARSRAPGTIRIWRCPGRTAPGVAALLAAVRDGEVARGRRSTARSCASCALPHGSAPSTGSVPPSRIHPTLASGPRIARAVAGGGHGAPQEQSVSCRSPRPSSIALIGEGAVRRADAGRRQRHRDPAFGRRRQTMVCAAAGRIPTLRWARGGVRRSLRISRPDPSPSRMATPGMTVTLPCG